MRNGKHNAAGCISNIGIRGHSVPCDDQVAGVIGVVNEKIAVVWIFVTRMKSEAKQPFFGAALYTAVDIKKRLCQQSSLSVNNADNAILLNHKQTLVFAVSNVNRGRRPRYVRLH